MTFKEFYKQGYSIEAVWTMDEAREFMTTDEKELENPKTKLDDLVSGTIIDTYPDNDITQLYIYDKDGNNVTPDKYGDYGITNKHDLLECVHNM